MKPLLLILCALFLAACDPHPRRHATHQTKTVSVHHLPDGRYVYQDDSGAFWMYMYLSQSTHSPAYYTSSSSSMTLPRGGAWVSANSTGIAAEDLQSAQQSYASATQVADEAVEVTTAGEPMSLAEATENAAYDGTEAHADGMSDDAPSAGASESSSDSGASSDSGSSGGGDSGGGGGE